MSTSPTESQRRTPSPRAGVRALALTALGAAGLVFLAGRPERPAAEPALRRPAPADTAFRPTQAERHPLGARPSPFESPEDPRRPAPESCDDFRARFVALAARDPLALEALAAGLFARDASEPETLAFLDVLRASGSPASVPWHEEAVRTGRPRGDGHSAGLAEAALRTLAADAVFDPAARAALARLAFETPALPPGPRRRAAAAYAAHAEDAELALLERTLACEPDATLVEGCLVALSERAPGYAVTRLLAVYGRGAADD